MYIGKLTFNRIEVTRCLLRRTNAVWTLFVSLGLKKWDMGWVVQFFYFCSCLNRHFKIAVNIFEFAKSWGIVGTILRISVYHIIHKSSTLFHIFLPPRRLLDSKCFRCFIPCNLCLPGILQFY